MSPLFILLLCTAYLLGSVSFAVLISQLRRLPDPRSMGSGNPGASNMLRLGGRPLALATLLGDLSKGALAVWLAQRAGLEPAAQGWVALAAVTGHILPIFHRLRGGKGVATAAGALLMLSWPVALLVCAIWLATFAILRIASVASITACVALLPWLAWYRPELLLACSIMVLLILARHRLNIGRLLTGSENHFKH
ncbi:glycerol-3-phosphate 1-O-acyltransferase PlsY [Halopseudomonas pelagia]|uniref:glycerol-3-phosphate 1-O-acyltransferase PlsY n=1 Tax=Halopseudomonas pelagia TaxID=553151 RepID=UPI0003A00F7C|nr:glycerol-3-phosphate 1-O-acyltransferase PlsY [Halopseudomonas pelagia]|tara:strand:+ start:203099 stop:203683 length:585 start_codon:yes stop_codon:yes gene_type:complete